MSASLTLTVSNILITAAKQRASYVHFTVGSYPTLRVDDNLVELDSMDVVTEEFLSEFVAAMLSEQQVAELEQEREVTFIKEFEGKFRFKINIFYQKNIPAVSLKLIPEKIPQFATLGLPKEVEKLAEKQNGLIIVAGPYGSGKTTTVAALIEEINKNRRENIVIVERPIEYLFFNNKSLIEQREVGRDAHSFNGALQYLREFDVDVIAVGTTREPGVIPMCVDLATSGHLVILQMTGTSAAQIVEDIFAEFKDEDMTRVASTLAEALEAIVCQRLVPRVGGGVVPATEIVIVNDAIRSLVRQQRVRQIETIIQSSRSSGMITLDQSLAELVRNNEVLIDRAMEHANDPSFLRKIIKQ